MPERVAIYPGSFDPLTLGHLNLIQRGLATFDKLIVAVVYNPNKSTSLFTPEERMAMIKEAVKNDPRVEVDAFHGLLVDYCEEKKANVVLRGLRAAQDFEYEFEMAMMNRRLRPGLELVFLMTDDAFFYISSTMVREVAKLGGDVSQFVPSQVLKHLKARFQHEPAAKSKTKKAKGT